MLLACARHGNIEVWRSVHDVCVPDTSRHASSRKVTRPLPAMQECTRVTVQYKWHSTVQYSTHGTYSTVYSIHRHGSCRLTWQPQKSQGDTSKYPVQSDLLFITHRLCRSLYTVELLILGDSIVAYQPWLPDRYTDR